MHGLFGIVQDVRKKASIGSEISLRYKTIRRTQKPAITDDHRAMAVKGGMIRRMLSTFRSGTVRSESQTMSICRS